MGRRRQWPGVGGPSVQLQPRVPLTGLLTVRLRLGTAAPGALGSPLGARGCSPCELSEGIHGEDAGPCRVRGVDAA